MGRHHRKGGRGNISPRGNLGQNHFKEKIFKYMRRRRVLKVNNRGSDYDIPWKTSGD